ncbi:phosphotransferase family protein [Mycolicibacterium sp. 22603]|uniref:phosphotransferase family protein n=1 Tax=Mycolicibacterium sp. 22603 TaxID=3453950 RepID=UPI003F84E61B
MNLEIDLAPVQTWLRERGIGDSITAARTLTGGTQNRVIALEVDGRRLVLRCPPAHPRPSSNRTMLREVAALTSLAGTAVPHPRLLACCDDLTVMDMVFYLMEEVDGFNPGDSISEHYRTDAATRHESGLAVARALAVLGELDPTGTPMAGFAKPGSFLDRQVDQWAGVLSGYEYGDNDAGDLPDVGRTVQWLRTHQPTDPRPGIMHGDFHLNNVLLDAHRPEVSAIVDWEMCTVGDPLLDLGWLLACWPQDPAPVATGERLAAAGGLPSRREVIEAYAATSSRSSDEIDWYTALAGFKMAVVLEGTWVRALSGHAPREIGEHLHRCAIGLFELSARIAVGDWSPSR